MSNFVIEMWGDNFRITSKSGIFRFRDRHHGIYFSFQAIGMKHIHLLYFVSDTEHISGITDFLWDPLWDPFSRIYEGLGEVPKWPFSCNLICYWILWRRMVYDQPSPEFCYANNNTKINAYFPALVSRKPLKNIRRGIGTVPNQFLVENLCPVTLSQSYMTF